MNFIFWASGRAIRLKHIFATLRYSPTIPDARNRVAILFAHSAEKGVYGEGEVSDRRKGSYLKKKGDCRKCSHASRVECASGDTKVLDAKGSLKRPCYPICVARSFRGVRLMKGLLFKADISDPY